MSIKIIQRKALDLVSILCLWFQSIMRSLVGFLLCRRKEGQSRPWAENDEPKSAQSANSDVQQTAGVRSRGDSVCFLKCPRALLSLRGVMLKWHHFLSFILAVAPMLCSFGPEDQLHTRISCCLIAIYSRNVCSLLNIWLQHHMFDKLQSLRSFYGHYFWFGSGIACSGLLNRKIKKGASL